MAEVEPDVVWKFPLRGKDRARRDADAVRERVLVQAQRIDLGGQFQPQEVAAIRPGQAEPGGKVSFDAGQQLRFLGRKLPALRSAADGASA